MLLGMLMTILTMIFSQSSIAWRTGMAVVADLDEIRENVAEVREESDNAYIWDNKVHRLLGLWDSKGELRKRAWNVGSGEDGYKAGFIDDPTSENAQLSQFNAKSVSSGKLGELETYTIIVKSKGPNGVLRD